MLNPKYTNNLKQNDFANDSFTQKKEEMPHSRVSVVESIFQPLPSKSGFSKKM